VYPVLPRSISSLLTNRKLGSFRPSWARRTVSRGESLDRGGTCPTFPDPLFPTCLPKRCYRQ
jgi:hypothetical protein